jgi:hypothetical protein
MDLVEWVHGLMHRSSQFDVQDWLTIFMCVSCVVYVALLTRSKECRR